MLPGIGDELHAYLERDAAPNNLFAFSETLLSEALLSLLKQLKANATLESLVAELFDVAVWFYWVADALMFILADSNCIDLTLRPPIEVIFKDLRDLKSVELPWFTDTTSAMSSGAGSA